MNFSQAVKSARTNPKPAAGKCSLIAKAPQRIYLVVATSLLDAVNRLLCKAGTYRQAGMRPPDVASSVQ